MTSAEPEFLRGYEPRPPRAQHQLDLFAGEWTSQLTIPDETTTSGTRPDLFDDERIHWAIGALGGIEGLDVVELGPLEGAHTAMLEAAGAASVVGVEAQRQAFLRCLVVKNLLGLSATFELGEVTGYLDAHPGGIDLIVASGILYHMADPLGLVRLMGDKSHRLILWTHYWDAEVMARRPDVAAHFTGEVEEVSAHGLSATLHRYEYGEGVDAPSFCGGTRPHTAWMERDQLVGLLQAAGFDEVTIGVDDPDFPHGPAFTLVAQTAEAAAAAARSAEPERSAAGPRRRWGRRR